MNGDFSRDTFNASKHFLRVLMQQGRVQLDADWNEQAAILLHYLQSLAADLIGPHGGPGVDNGKNFGFGITWSSGNKDLDIGFGHYYVDGILCENDQKFDAEGELITVTYFSQPDYPVKTGSDNLPGFSFLVYLDVWERHITMIEDPEIREQALGESDTATRAKILWQVKTIDSEEAGIQITKGNVLNSENWKKLTEVWQPSHRGQLKVQGKQTTGDESVCNISPEARFRGAENQLYRVEIHRPGIAWDGDEETKEDALKEAATFKWSRDNGVVIYPIKKMNFATENSITTTTVTVYHFGREARFAPTEGDWVEILDDDYVLQVGSRIESGSGRKVENLFKIIRIDQVNRQIILEGKPSSTVGTDATKHPFLRRWDHHGGDPKKTGQQLADDGALVIEEDKWLNLEDGVQVFFKPIPSGGGGQVVHHHYRHGDYWLIPARTATGDVEWPKEKDEKGNLKKDNNGNLIPEALPPHGVEHHYAPLAVVNSTPSSGSTGIENCRRQFSLSSIIPAAVAVAPTAEIVSSAETTTPQRATKKTGAKTKDAP